MARAAVYILSKWGLSSKQPLLCRKSSKSFPDTGTLTFVSFELENQQ